MPKKTLKKFDNQVTSVYDKIPKSMKTEYQNPNFDEHQINIPFRMLVVGASGSGKSSVAIFLLSKMKNTFGNIKIFCRNKDEPLLEYLKTKIPKEQLPNLDLKDNEKGFNPTLQHLVIFDDLVLLKDAQSVRISEYFIRARKIAKGISLMYLTQSYFRTPKTIRLNVNYLVVKKVAALRDLKFMMNEYNLGSSKEKLLEIYKYCTGDRNDFLLIDVDELPEKKFRKNLLEILHVVDDNKLK